MRLDAFPPLNASLNGTSATLLLIGYVFIRSGQIRAHAAMMIAAFVTSSVFLVSYLTYHVLRARQGTTLTRFPPGSLRPIYLAILASHTLLAVVILPLILLTLSRAYRRLWARHRWIGRVTLPLWFYVSATGVVIYWMLYFVAPRLAH